jgi:Arc/MetJ-type ribon-helix-helix transcriptional regulator
MAYEFPAGIAETIDGFLSSGEYTDVDDVLRKALDALQTRMDYQAIVAGLVDVEAGRYRPLDEIDAETRTKYGFAHGDNGIDSE